VQAATDLDANCPNPPRDGSCALHRPRRSVEERHGAVAGLLDVAAAISVQLELHQLVVLRQHVAPGSVTNPLEVAG
jgi:hypothetical protein